MPRTKQGPHRASVTRMLRATGLVNVPEEAPLVELVKALAAEMDSSPGARVRADYLSALKDVRRVLNGSGGKVRGSSESKTVVKPEMSESEDELTPVPNDLAVFKAAHKIT